MARGLRNNNPGNIRHSSERWQGEVATTDKSFKAFESMAHGYRAIFKLLYNYQHRYRLNTIRELVGRWAPPNENDTDNYVDRVAKWSGVGADQRVDALNMAQMTAIVAAMSRMENGVPAVMKDVEAGWRLFVK